MLRPLSAAHQAATDEIKEVGIPFTISCLNKISLKFTETKCFGALEVKTQGSGPMKGLCRHGVADQSIHSLLLIQDWL